MMSERASRADLADAQPVPPDVVAIVAALQAKGHLAYLVGGCVRDRLMGKEPKDFDVATDARPDDVKRVFPKAIGVGAAFGVMLVSTATQRTVEIATFRKDGTYSDHRRPDSVEFSSPEEDSARRDFTMNGLFYDVAKDQIVDFVGGVQDIRDGVVRCIGEPRERFAEDALRLLRACRFAAVLGFEIDPKTMDAMRERASDISQISAERILGELDRGLSNGHARDFIELLDQSGLLEHVLPEIAAMKGCTQPEDWHPEGDVYVHTLLVLSHLPKDASLELVWAALLHDVGKPVTRTVTDRIRFLQHAEVGAGMVETIGQRLRFPAKRIELVQDMVRRHMTWGNVPQMRTSTRRRFFASPIIDQEFALHRADSLGSLGTTQLHDECRQLYDADRATETSVQLPEPLIRGGDVIERGIIPGPRIGELLHQIQDAQLEGQVASREEALRLLDALVCDSELPK